MVVYHKESSNLQIIKEFSIDYHFSELHYNIVKSSITVFINEVLYRVVKEEEANPQLFEFLYNAIQFLDITDGNINNFHLMFLVKLSQFLGFYPSGIFSEKTPYFDMMEGGFKAEVPLHSYCLNEEESKILGELKLLPFDKSDLIKLTSLQRNVMIDNLLAFYKLHIPNFSEIKSREVLKVVFS
ncbi:MAG: DNA repair protein RecO C-terminal domain-containing protein, partial [Bacteroidota bacterium]|nr:DNA repair protein RecO C-terminal domain-containing protein [Bacteroidota bacterium]